jgi:hypothetical protein
MVSVKHEQDVLESWVHPGSDFPVEEDHVDHILEEGPGEESSDDERADGFGAQIFATFPK